MNKIYRVFDFSLSLLCLVFLLPLFLIICLLIKLDSSGPIFFKQKRVGKKELPFYMFKFRSMVVNTLAPEKLGPIKHSHALVTRLGSILRRTKLDEIPQFINVLYGEMSLIGPRPCLYSRIQTMSIQERRRFDVLPGITGWAEVNGNVELDWNEQLMLDLWYVDNKTFYLNCFIFFKTILIVILGSTKNMKALNIAKNDLGIKLPK